MRSFVAILLDAGVRQQLVRVVRELAATAADVKWVEETNFHLTLQFLGDISPEQVEAVKGCLAKAAAGVSRFSLEVHGVGRFPGRGRPRILWAGLREGRTELTHLASRVNDALEPLGLVPDKPFASHITLGRLRSSRGLQGLLDRLPVYEDYLFGSQEVTGITLVESRLERRGPTYEPRAGFLLDAILTDNL